jgi:hypothetical protein
MKWHLFYESGEVSSFGKLSSRELLDFENQILFRGDAFIKIDSVRIYFIGSGQWLLQISEALNGKV